MVFAETAANMGDKLAKFVRSELDRRGWSARRFAIELGLSPMTITNILNGVTDNPRPEVIAAIAKLTGLPYYRVRMMADPQLEADLESLVSGIPDKYLSLAPEVLEFAVRFMALPQEVRDGFLPASNAKK